MASNYNITVYDNDTYPGVEFTITVNSIPLSLVDASIRMQVRQTRTEPAVIDISSGSGITITDAAAGKFKIDAQIFTGVPKTYLYDIEITLADNSVKTYIKGNFIILGDITHA
jgi:hypothetical protein